MAEHEAPDEDFLVARVSSDMSVVGLEHESGADWYQVLRAHVVLRDKLQERIDRMDQCPRKPAPCTLCSGRGWVMTYLDLCPRCTMRKTR